MKKTRVSAAVPSSLDEHKQIGFVAGKWIARNQIKTVARQAKQPFFLALVSKLISKRI
jgi:hypothetical protein